MAPKKTPSTNHYFEGKVSAWHLPKQTAVKLFFAQNAHVFRTLGTGAQAPGIQHATPSMTRLHPNSSATNLLQSTLLGPGRLGNAVRGCGSLLAVLPRVQCGQQFHQERHARESCMLPHRRRHTFKRISAGFRFCAPLLSSPATSTGAAAEERQLKPAAVIGPA